MIHVALIRHGKTPGNRRKAYIGCTNESLDKATLDEVKKRDYPKVGLLFVSPLMRCVQTAQLLYPTLKQIAMPQLAECDFGDFEGKNYDQLKHEPAYQAWIDSGGMAAFPNGEDSQSFRNRCVEGFLEAVDIAVLSKANEMTMVCHGGTIMAILERFSEPSLGFYTWQVANLGGFVFDFDEKKQKATHIKPIEDKSAT